MKREYAVENSNLLGLSVLVDVFIKEVRLLRRLRDCSEAYVYHL